MGERKRLAQESVKTLSKIASSLKVPRINVMRKSCIADTIFRKRRGQEYYHQIYEEA